MNPQRRHKRARKRKLAAKSLTVLVVITLACCCSAPYMSSSISNHCITDVQLKAAATSSVHQIFVASAMRNALLYLPDFFQSLTNQDYPHLSLILCDDNSLDGSAEWVVNKKASYPFSTTLLRLHEQRGKAHAKWRLVERIRMVAAPMDIVLFINADDKLFRHDVLAEIDKAFKRNKPWYAHGHFRGYFEEECTAPLHRDNDTMFIQDCPPHLLRAFLLNALVESDFQNENGSWIEAQSESKMARRAMQLAGDRIRIISAGNTCRVRPFEMHRRPTRAYRRT